MAPVVPNSLPPLPAKVADACTLYGFGDREEVSANYQRAMQMHLAGAPADAIVEAVRNGAKIEELFV